MLKNPSPRINPYPNPVCQRMCSCSGADRRIPCQLTEASTINGVSSLRRYCRQYQLIRPPIVRASVKDGTLYMPT